MYSYIDDDNNTINIKYEVLITLISRNKNIMRLSKKLNVSVQKTKEILKELALIGIDVSYKKNQYMEWSVDEDRQLVQEFNNRMAIKDISAIHGRTTGAIRSRLKHNNLYDKIYGNRRKEKRETIFSGIKANFIIPTVPEYINLDKFINISEDDYEKYLDFGITIGEIISEYLENNETKRKAKIFKYRMNIIDNEDNTLQSIGERYGISRERVRQILVKLIRKFKGPLFGNIYLGKIIDLINSIDKDEIMNYYVYGIINVYNKEFLKFILDLVDENYSNKIFEKINDLIKLLKSDSESDRAIKGDIASQIKYPSIIKNYSEQFYTLKQMREVNPENNTGTVYLPRFNRKFEYESLCEKNVLEMLEQNEDILDIKVQSLVIKYIVNGKTYDYYPDFQLLFKDGRMAIIEIKNIYSMGEFKVRQKYKALKLFCEKNGIGYLMIDDRMNNYEAIKENNVDEQTKQAFMKYLETHNPMKYPDLLEFKKTTKLRTKDFVNMTINDERIMFNASPFYIRFNN